MTPFRLAPALPLQMLVLLVGCSSSIRHTVPQGAANSGPVVGSFIYKDHLIFVRASVNGSADKWALIDTGANVSAIDSKFADELKLNSSAQSTVHGSAGAIQARSVTLGEISIFGAKVKSTAATAYPLGVVAPDGQPVSLIIGYPFLKHFAVEVDYPGRRMTLHDSTVASKRSIPMRLDNGIPCVKASLNGTAEVDLRIDTGASLFDTKEPYLNITSFNYETLQKNGFDRPPAFHLKGSGVGGLVDLPVIRLDFVRLGLTTIERPYAIVQPRAGIFADPKIPGFVGNYTLEPLGRIAFDYLDQRLKIMSPP